MGNKRTGCMGIILLLLGILILTPQNLAGRAAGEGSALWVDPAWGGHGIAHYRIPVHHADRGIQDLVPDTQGRLLGVGSVRVNLQNGNDTDFGVARLLQDGSLDPTFGGTGWIATDIGTHSPDEAVALTLDEEGRIVVAGCAEVAGGVASLTVVRYLPDGQLDTTFGTQGKVITPLATAVTVGCELGIALDANGRIVVAGGRMPEHPNNSYIFRLLESGDLDPTFGNGGYVHDQTAAYRRVFITQAGNLLLAGTRGEGLVAGQYTPDGTYDLSYGTSGQTLLLFQEPQSWIAYTHNATLAPDGSLFLVGELYTPSLAPDGRSYQGVAVKLDASGTLDPTFGESGIVRQNLSGYREYLTSIHVQPAGTLLLGTYAPDYRGAVQSLLSDGSPNPAFGDNGVQFFPFDDFEPDGALWADPQHGQVYVGGRFNRWAVRRLNVNGSFDHTFGERGMTLFGLFRTSVNPLTARLPDGGWLTLGYASFPGEHLLLQLTAQGHPDPALGGEGWAFAERGNYYNYRMNAMHLDPQGRIVTAGAMDRPSGNAQWALARHLASGDLDTTFGTGGILSESVSGSTLPTVLLEQTDGKLVTLGTGGGAVRVVRYLENGSRDPGYGTSGVVTVSCPGSGGLAARALLQADDAVLLTGGCPASDSRLWRLTARGALDPTFGTGGMVLLNPTGYALRPEVITLDSAGRILVAGKAFVNPRWYGIVTRILPNGTVDATFGEEGYSIFEMASSVTPDPETLALLQNPGGQWYLIGREVPSTSGTSVFVYRLLASGGLDSGFGVAGKQSLQLSLSDEITDVDAAPEGIVLTGGFHYGTTTTTSPIFGWTHLIAAGSPPLTPTSSPTATPVPSGTLTPVASPTANTTETPTASPTLGATATPTIATPTPSPSATSPLPQSTPTNLPSMTSTPTMPGVTPTPTLILTVVPGSATPTATMLSTATPSPVVTPSVAPATATPTPTGLPSSTLSYYLPLIYR